MPDDETKFDDMTDEAVPPRGESSQPEQIGSADAGAEMEAPLEDDETGDRDSSAPDLHLADQEGAEVTVDQIVEAILFSCESPLAANKIAAAVGGINARDVHKIVNALNERYEQSRASFLIESLAGGYQMLTRPEYATYLQRFYKVRSENRLSTAALETLAVVAYKQPVVRAEIEAIRGVACSDVLRSLMEKGLIRIVGRANELGRPMLYGTTKRFLEIFGMRGLEDLPKIPELHLPGRTEEPKPTAEQGEEPEAPKPSPEQQESTQPESPVETEVPQEQSGTLPPQPQDSTPPQPSADQEPAPQRDV